ncbi:MAG: hypothetical protein ACOZNI_19885 [Myxococcota bacterium]
MPHSDADDETIRLLRDVWLGGLLLALRLGRVRDFEESACSRARLVAMGESDAPPESLARAARAAPLSMTEDVVRVSSRTLLVGKRDDPRAWRSRWLDVAGWDEWRREFDRQVRAATGELAVGIEYACFLGLRTAHLEVLGSAPPRAAAEALRKVVVKGKSVSVQRLSRELAVVLPSISQHIRPGKSATAPGRRRRAGSV